MEKKLQPLRKMTYKVPRGKGKKRYSSVDKVLGKKIQPVLKKKLTDDLSGRLYVSHALSKSSFVKPGDDQLKEILQKLEIMEAFRSEDVTGKGKIFDRRFSEE